MSTVTINKQNFTFSNLPQSEFIQSGTTNVTINKRDPKKEKFQVKIENESAITTVFKVKKESVDLNQWKITQLIANSKNRIVSLTEKNSNSDLTHKMGKIEPLEKAYYRSGRVVHSEQDVLLMWLGVGLIAFVAYKVYHFTCNFFSRYTPNQVMPTRMSLGALTLLSSFVAYKLFSKVNAWSKSESATALSHLQQATNEVNVHILSMVMKTIEHKGDDPIQFDASQLLQVQA